MKNLNKYQKMTGSFFLIVVALWIFLRVTNRQTGDLNYWYSFLFGLIPLFGGFVGMMQSRIWGGLKSTLGRGVFFVSLGLFMWGFGETIWSYYNFFKDVPAPYPSLADIGFATSIVFWIIGTAFLAKTTGAIFALKKTHLAKILAVFLPLILLIPSYYVQVTLARNGTLVPSDESLLKTILDIIYPFGDFLALTLAALVALLSYRYFGGAYRRSVIFLLLGLAVMYVADSIFSYTTTEGTYYNANFGDLLLASGQFLMAFGILGFASKPPIKSFDKDEK